MILTTQSGPLYFEVAGEGSPLVFVSGWAMSCEYWRPAVELLQRGYRCLTYDLRGVARSQPFHSNARFTIEDHAEDLHRILHCADIYDATIVGHETGALVAATCALNHPQDVRSLVVVSPRAAMTEADVKRLAVFTPASLALREMAAFPVIRNIVTRRFRRAPKAYRDALYNDFANLDPRAAYETALSASSEEAAITLRKVIERGVSPALFICGDKDRKGSVEARRLFSIASAGKLATLKDCGFLPMLEYPRQFARLIHDFAAKSKASASRSLSRR
jgi:pimeloyl-ACP methyl ester carboxylesterase